MESLKEISTTMAGLAIIYAAFCLFFTHKFPKHAIGVMGLVILLPFTAALIPKASSLGDAIVLVILAVITSFLSLRMILGKAIWNVVMGNIVYDILKTSVRISQAAVFRAARIFKGGI